MIQLKDELLYRNKESVQMDLKEFKYRLANRKTRIQYGQISDIGDNIVTTTKNEIIKKKKWDKWRKENVRFVIGNNKRNTLWIIGVLEVEKNQNGEKKLAEDIITQDFSDIWRYTTEWIYNF